MAKMNHFNTYILQLDSELHTLSPVIVKKLNILHIPISKQ